MKKRKPLMRAWVGVMNGRPDIEREPDAGRDGYCALYKRRRDARRYYEQVTRVVIYEDAP